MRSMYWQLGIFGTLSLSAYRHRETKKNLCRDGLFVDRVRRLPPASLPVHYSLFNPLKPNDPYRCRTAPLTSKVAFYIFTQQI